MPRTLRFLLPGLLGLAAPAADWDPGSSPVPARVLVLANAADADSLDLARRYVAGEPVRSIKSDPQFIDQREYILSRVFDQREAFS